MKGETAVTEETAMTGETAVRSDKRDIRLKTVTGEREQKQH